MQLREWIARGLLSIGAGGEWGKHTQTYKERLLIEADDLIFRLQKAGYGRVIFTSAGTTGGIADFYPINREDKI